MADLNKMFKNKGKMEKMWHHLSDWQLVVRYVVSGLAGAVSNLVTYSFLVKLLNIWYLTSAIIAFLVALVISFLLQKLWTFKDDRREVLVFQGSWYLIIALAMLALNLVTLSLFVEVLVLPKILAQAVALVGLSSLSFFVNKTVTFRL